MKTFRFVLLFVFAAISLTACQTASAPVVATASSPTPVSAAGDYWTLVQQAEDAYATGDFAAAMQSARRAIALDAENETAWDLYTQASIANAGDQYLQNMPDHRYRLPVEVFVRDEVNHSRDWFVIDVREPEEYAAGHIEGAVNIPFREVLQHLDELPNQSASILVYCHSQKRATHVLVVLRELGYSKVYNLEGGYEAYEEWMKNNVVPTPGPTPTPGPEEPDFGC